VKIVTAILGILFNLYGAKIADFRGAVVAATLFSSVYFLWLTILTFSKPTAAKVRRTLR
jgi:hypothetical protein